MSTRFLQLDHDVTCIDTLYTAPDIACCYLVGDSGEYAFIETGTARSMPEEPESASAKPAPSPAGGGIDDLEDDIPF